MGGSVDQLMLVIVDGWGLREEKAGNAVKMARTPHLDRFLAAYPSTQLTASGEAVGLMAGQMGDSNVGHLNLGAGRIVYQDLVRISQAIKDGELKKNKVIQRALEEAKEEGKSLHLMGLLSDGGVHSHIEHLFGLLDQCQSQDIDSVYVHAFLDGRDVLPKSADTYIKALEAKLENYKGAKLATVMGRYYAMDRDNRWDRIEKAYHAMTEGVGRKTETGRDAVAQAYQAGETDEFVYPTVIVDDEEKPTGTIKAKDVILFFNFRADRAREITRAFIEKEFERISRPSGFLDVHMVCMTEYDKTIDAPVAFLPKYIQNSLGEVLSREGRLQLRIAETEKYAHVTFFFNGGQEEPFSKEERFLVPSPPVSTYDLVPQMSAHGVKNKLISSLREGKYQVYIVNFANLDMVGHSGNFPATVKAAETVDQCVGEIAEEMALQKGCMLLVSDHGNAEDMIENGTGKPYTSHTSNAVPFVLVDQRFRYCRLAEGILGDVAPTILDILNIEKPAEMTGHSLLRCD